MQLVKDKERRRCCTCKETKLIVEFYNKQYQCKVCSRVAVRRWQLLNPERDYKHKRSAEVNLRPKVIEFFGGHCVICGFDDVRALQLDHIDGGGRQERLKKGTYGIYRNALRHPEQYQLLCANHNMIKMFENKERYKIHKEE